VRRLIGSQLQDSALPDRIRVWEALRLFSVIDGDGRGWERLLEEWGLADRRNAALGDLSGGQRQRLFVALALVAEPRLVVLDEMTTGLDPAVRRTAWELVAAIRDRGASVLLVTHFMDEAAQRWDRVAVLRAGRIVGTDSPSELVASAARWSTVRFTAPDLPDVGFLEAVAGVQHAVREAAGRVVVRGEGPVLARVAHALVERGFEPDDLRGELPTLEDANLALVGGEAVTDEAASGGAPCGRSSS
jgi:ABC-2 type transport system ATP-binding protein